MNTRKDEDNLSSAVLMQLAKSEDYKVEGEHEKALELAQKILKKDPGCIPAAEEVLDNLVSLQRFEEAHRVATFVLSKEKESYIAHYAFGFLFLTEGNNQKALKYLLKANSLNPNNPEILRCLGWAHFHCDAKLKGLVTLERALNLRAEDPLILCDLGVCLLHEHVFGKAINLFERALALDPENIRAEECLHSAIELEERFKLLKEKTGEASPLSLPNHVNSFTSHDIPASQKD